MKFIKYFLFSSLVIFSSSSFATFYLGGGLAFKGMKYNNANTDTFYKNTLAQGRGLSVEKQKKALTFLIGYEFNENIALELGYELMSRKNKSTIEDSNIFGATRYRKASYKIGNNKYIDVVSSYPINEDFALLGTAGLGFYTSELTVQDKQNGRYNTNIVVDKSNQPRVRLGAGVKYNITNNLYTRTLFNWQHGDSGFVKHQKTVGLALVYRFDQEEDYEVEA